MKSYLYSRISTLQQVTGFGIERQIQNVTDFLKYAQLDSRLGYQLDPENYEILESDLGKSAFKGANWKPTSNLGKFYDMVVKGEITCGVLICENIDRLTRLSNYEAASKLTALITRGIDIVEVESGACFSNRIPDSMTMLNMSISRAYNESLRKSNMAKKSWENRRNKLKETGKAISNNLPRWIEIEDDKYIVNSNIHAFTKMLEMYADGFGVTNIIRVLNSSDLLNDGKKWNSVTAYRALRDRRLIGYIESGADKKEIRQYPIAVDEVLFSRVQTLLGSKTDNNQRRTTKHQRNLFNGVTRCGKCGAAMVVDTNGHGRLFFVCITRRNKGDCDAMYIPYAGVERELLNHANGLTFEETEDTDTSVMDELRFINNQIESLQEEAKNADDDEVLLLVRSIKNKKARRLELEAEVSAMAVTPAKVTFDIPTLTNQENVSERQTANVMIKKVISTLYLFRTGNELQIEIKYHLPHFRHTILMDVRKDKLHGVAFISQDGLMDLGFMKINLNTAEVEQVRDMTADEIPLLNMYEKFMKDVVKKAMDLMK